MPGDYRASRPLLVHPGGVAFGPARQGVAPCCVLRLRNPSENGPRVAVAYKLRTTKPKFFTVKQSEGVLRPGEWAEVRITLRPNAQPDAGSPKFQVQLGPPFFHVRMFSATAG